MAKVGRPTKYSEEILEKTYDYLANHENYGDLVPSIVGLACHLRVASNTLYNWGRAEGNEEFLSTLKEIEENQHRKLVTGGLGNVFNPTITKLMLSNHGYSEKIEEVNKKPDVTIKTDVYSAEEAARVYQELVKGKE